MDLESLMSGLGPLQERMQADEAKRDDERFAGRAGGGAVTVEITGALRVDKVVIAEAAATAADGDVSMLEDLVAAAVNDALNAWAQRYGRTPEEQVQKLLQGQDMGALMSQLLGGFGSPG